MSHPIQRRSSLFLIGALTVLSACGETNPVAPVTAPSNSQKTAGGNAANAKACQKNGWQDLATSTGASFASETECVSYGAHGGILYQKQTITFAALAAKNFGDGDF